jgi:hypothetical protein
LVTEDPVAIAALTQIEFLWQDLDAVQAWMKSPAAGCFDVEVEWITAEMGRRQEWLTGLRRAWLLALFADSWFRGENLVK